MSVEFNRVHSYSMLPFRFARIPGISARVLMTSEAGEYIFLSITQFEQMLAGDLSDEPIALLPCPERRLSALRRISGLWRASEREGQNRGDSAAD